VATITYPDGTSLTSTAIDERQAQSMMQLVTGRMLGVLMTPYSAAALATLPPALSAVEAATLAAPWQTTLTLTAGQSSAPAASTALLYPNQTAVGTGLQAGTRVTAVGPGNLVWLSLPATVSGPQTATFADPDCFSAVRVGWQQEGQPAWNIAADICVVRCEPIDTDYGRMRDSVQSLQGITAVFTDTYTRAWRVYWAFYGPNSTDRARAVRSALVTIQQFADLLATAGWYVNPSISMPQRVPELFQGQWWPRTDLYADFNEQVTETYATGTVEQVQVIVNRATGVYETLTIQGD